MKSKLLTLFCLFFSLIIWAVPPAGYYTSFTLDGKNTNNLQIAFQAIITNGHSVTSYDGLWNAYKTTDINPSTGKIWDIYSNNCNFTWGNDQCGNYSKECDCYNREHTTPQSWFNGASPMYSDLFNVYPTDGYVNNKRGNYPYGEVGSATYTSGNGSKLGTSNFSGYNGTVFEPIDEYKGDLARTYFYMATRYADQCGTWTNGNGSVVYTSTLGLTSYAINLFLKWSREDPVSQKEIDRNDAVYSIQNNRNPFIDFPGLEEYIWGNKTSEPFYVNNTTVVKPTVNSPVVSNITAYSATLGGTVISDGGGTITETGIYYSTTNGFADGDGIKISTTTPVSGAFTVSVVNLIPSTTYYFKAYATNSAGTGFSEQASFTTKNPSTDIQSEIILGNPVPSGATFDYGKVSNNATKSFFIKTKNLIGDLSVIVSGEMFSVSTNIISKTDADAGYTLYIYYQPIESGFHSGSVTISGGGLPADFIIRLTGSR